jgi:hypothetical protein
MAEKRVNSHTKPKQRRRVMTGTKAHKMASLLAKSPKMGPAKAAQLAGYSPNTPLSLILKTRTYQEIALPIETQRAAIQKIPGFTLADAVDYSKKIRDTEGIDPRAGLAANGQLIELLNYMPTKTINVRETRLFAELKDVSSEDLALLVGSVVSGE